MLKLITALLSLSLATDRPARRFLNENRLEDALATCRQIEAQSKTDKDGLLDCAWVYFRTAHIETAEKTIDRLRAHFALFEFQLLNAYAFIAKKEFDKAREALDALAKKFKEPANATRIEELNGELYEALGNLGAAAFVYQHVIEQKPGSSTAHWALGRHYQARKDYSRARIHFEKTAQLWPRHLGSRYQLATIALLQENDEQAVRWLIECVRIDKADPGVLELLGNLYERQGKIQDALRYWQKALAINPKSTTATDKVGKYVTQVIDKLLEAKNYKKALEQLEGFSPGKKATGKTLFLRGTVYRQLAQYDKALADLSRYLAENPKTTESKVFRELGICYINMKLYDPAGNHFLKAVDLEPNEGMNWAWLGFALEAKGEDARAREAWRRAVELINNPEELSQAARRLATLEKKLNGPKPEEKK